MLNDGNFIGFYSMGKDYGYMSNWYPAGFKYAGKSFISSEQFMMYQKMMTFGQYKIALDIMKTPDPKECKSLGRTPIRNWDSVLWDRIRYVVVKRGIRAKFFQNKDLLKSLLDTGDAILAECSPTDRNWGIGLDSDDPARFDVNKWTGENLLGRTLMEVRDEFTRLASISEKNLMESEFYDVHDINDLPFMKMSLNELLRIPKLHSSVDAYAAVCQKFGDVDMLDMSLNELENILRSTNDGSYPVQGFFELKQDLYDIENSVFTLR